MHFVGGGKILRCSLVWQIGGLELRERLRFLSLLKYNDSGGRDMVVSLLAVR